MSILRTEHLVKTYETGDGCVRAVDDVTLSVEKGEFVAIIGASGSGKSTLMHLIGGVDRPTSGKIFVEDQEITGMNNDKLAIFRRRQIGVVYQFYNLIPILTAEENITLPLELDGAKPDPALLEKLMKDIGISERRHNLPNELSGGQQQRVAIARAVITRPALMLADEPTGNLDSQATAQIMQLFRMMNQEYHQTIIMITHDTEIAKQAGRVLRISDGKLVGEA